MLRRGILEKGKNIGTMRWVFWKMGVRSDGEGKRKEGWVYIGAVSGV
jgi:hypothetical protein